MYTTSAAACSNGKVRVPKDMPEYSTVNFLGPVKQKPPLQRKGIRQLQGACEVPTITPGCDSRVPSV